MRLLIISFLIVLQGCAAFTRRNYIDLNEAKKDTVNNSDRFVYGDSEFEIEIYNRNSNLAYLSVGPLIPFIPWSLFSRDLTHNEHFTIELILSSKSGKYSDAVLDFSALKVEEPLTKYRSVCWQYSANQIENYKGYDLSFLQTDKLFASGKKVYQIDCKLAANSIPPSEGIFLKIDGIKALDKKAQKTYQLPDLVFKYRNTYQYEFFQP